MGRWKYTGIRAKGGTKVREGVTRARAKEGKGLRQGRAWLGLKKGRD